MSYTLIQRLCYAYATDKEVMGVLNRVHKDIMLERYPRGINESAENIKITGEVRGSPQKQDDTKYNGMKQDSTKRTKVKPPQIGAKFKLYLPSKKGFQNDLTNKRDCATMPLKP